MSDIISSKRIAERIIGLEEEVKALKLPSTRHYLICNQAKELRIYPEPGTAPALEDREDDVLYFCKIEKPGEMVLVCKIPSANYALDLSPWLSAAPGDGTTDISIDWGDKSAVVDYSVTETPGNGTITHTFATAGEYRITLKGSFGWGLGKQTLNTSLQATLTSIELPFDNSPIKDVSDYAFCYYTALTSIPAGLFDNCTEVTSFSGCFYNCSALTSIPQGLFDKCTKVTDFSGCFSSCSALTSIPQGLFDNCTEVTSFYACFYYCSALTSIPAGLFDNCTAVTDFERCFYNCSALTSIPQGLFDDCTAVTTFSNCFYYCIALTSIPAGLFDNCTAVTDFSYCFFYCYALTSALPTLWISHASASHTYCFRNCTKATNYADAQAARWV